MWGRGRGFAVAIVLVAAAGYVRADDEEPAAPAAAPDPTRWVTAYLEALAAGSPKVALDLLTTDAAAALAKFPARVLEVSRASARRLPLYTSNVMYADWFVRVGQSAKDEKPDDATAQRALAAAYGVKCRLAARAGGGITTEECVALAQNALGSYAGPAGDDKGRICAEGAGWLRLALEVEGVDRAEVVARLEALAQKAATGAGEFPAIARAEAELGKAFAAVAESPAEAKKSMDRFFTALQPFAASAKPPIALSSLYTEGLSFARTNKIPAAREYVMTVRKSEQDYLRFGIPASDTWRASTGGKEGTIAAVEQYDRWGVNRIRRVAFQVHLPGKNYQFPSGAVVDGGNLKALARNKFELECGAMASVKSKKEPTRVAMSRAYPQAEAFDVVGENDGAYVRLRFWVFKPKEFGGTFTVLVQEDRENPGRDAEVEAVLESITEPKKGK